MKFVKFITYLFYRYYSKGVTKDVAYIKTVCSAVLLILINIWIVLILFNRTNIIPDTTNVFKGIKYLTVALYTLPLFLFFFLFIKERDLINAIYDEEVIKKSGKYLYLYIVLSIILLFVLMFAFAGRNSIK